MEDYSKYVPNVIFEQIPIKNLVSSQDYQRNLSMKHVKKAVENFDLYQINPVKVSRRNGINYVFNGQHTIEIVATVSGSRDTPVWCMVYDDLYYEHEADIFANQMKYTKALSPYEIFVANIEAGNDKQLIIRDLVESFGLHISSTKQVGAICAISTIENIYDKYGLQNLTRVLSLTIGTWEGDVNSFSANMLSAMARLIFTYDAELVDDVFKEKLGERSIREITRSAHERSIGSLGFAEAILFFYNRKMKYPLDILKLHKTKGRKPVMYSEEDETENMEEYINGTDNSSQDDETDEQQSFFAPVVSEEIIRTHNLSENDNLI